MIFFAEDTHQMQYGSLTKASKAKMIFCDMMALKEGLPCEIQPFFIETNSVSEGGKASIVLFE
jgi:hypothetical protein